MNDSDNSAQLRRLGERHRTRFESERLRVAHQLHDEIGQALTVMKKQASWVVAHPEAPWSAIEERLRSFIQIADDTIRVVRGMTAELRPGVLDLGLSAAVEWQAEEFQKRTGIECILTLFDDDDLLGVRAATQGFRIFQQVLDNIQKHAAATQIRIVLEQHKDYVTLEVRDNGCGISEANIASPESLGLFEMRERALSIGGEFSIHGNPGEGTTVVVRIPLAQHAQG